MDFNSDRFWGQKDRVGLVLNSSWVNRLLVMRVLSACNILLTPDGAVTVI